MNSVPVAIAYAANSQWLPLIGFVLLRRNAMRCYSNLSVVTMTVANGSHQFGIGEGHVWIRRNGPNLQNTPSESKQTRLPSTNPPTRIFVEFVSVIGFSYLVDRAVGSDSSIV